MLNIMNKGDKFMIFLKYVFLSFIFAGASLIGVLISKKYKNRVEELKSFKEAYNILESKIKFTYEPLGDIFEEIADIYQNNNISSIFKNTSINMKKKDFRLAWNEAVEKNKQQLNLKKDDINIIKSLGNMLGKTDVQGQLSEISLNMNFLDTQIRLAEDEQYKNEKMYRTLGTIVGLAIIIILI